MKKVSVFLLLFTFIVIPMIVYYSMGSSITYPSLALSIPEARSRRFGLIIDVRSLKERETLGFYPNSIPISVHRLQQEVPMDISNKATSILVYSNGDYRAQKGAETLYAMGYRNVNYITKPYLALMPGSSMQ